MRVIERATVFERDFNRLKSTPHHYEDIDASLTGVVARLLADQTLSESNRDRALGVNWRGYRECHIQPDLVLLYRKRDAETLRLARLGVHFGERDRSYRSLVTAELGGRDRDVSDDVAQCRCGLTDGDVRP